MKERLLHQFDTYCKRTLHNERIDYYRQRKYRMEHEVFLCDLEEALTDKYLVTQDTYMLGEVFEVFGHKIEVYDECLAIALCRLPEHKRIVILMSFFLGMSDVEIGRFLGRAGSSIHTRRTTALAELRRLMEGMDCETE